MKQIDLIQIKLTLKLFTAHYKQAPLQAAAILIGIFLAVLLFVAVQAINLNAKRSYSNVSELLSVQAKALITPLALQHFLPESVYFSLRQHGLSQALPVIEGRVRDEKGRRWHIQGSELIAAITALQHAKTKNAISLSSTKLPLAQLIAGKPMVLISQSKHQSIGLVEYLQLDNVKTQVVALPDDWQLGHRALMDISFAQKLLNKKDKLSYIAVFDKSLKKHWQPLLDKQAQWITNNKSAELDSLTESFHLNLTAMSLLAFLVGLFITYNGVKYSLLKRNRLLVQIKQAGIAQQPLFIALLLELSMLIFIGTTFGFFAGIKLSDILQPTVALTLEQLYDAAILPSTWRWQWWLQAFIFTLVLTHIACWQHCKAVVSKPLASHSGFYHTPESSKAKALFVTALILTSLALLGLWQSEDHRLTMAWLAVLVIAIPLYLPLLLTLLATGCEKISHSMLLHYAFAELKELISPLSLAMMALLLAVTANIAMNRLVGSFESTLTQWLEQKLHADIYLSLAKDQIANIEPKLKTYPEIKAIYKQYSVNEKLNALPILLGTKDNISLEQSTVFKAKLDDFWPKFYRGELVAISEPTAVKLNLSLGNQINLAALSGHQLQVGAIFYDYGTPYGEVLISPKLWQQNGFVLEPNSLGLKISAKDDNFHLTLHKELSLHPSQVVNQAQIKSTALDIFSQTFAITKKLNFVTLLVAAVGLFCSCFMLFDARKAAIARLYALGVNRQKLLFLVLWQMLVLVSFTLIIALPLGALVGFILTDIVTLRAFGWSLFYAWSWQDALMLSLIALLVAALATVIPLWRLVSKPMMSTLQSEVL